MIVCRYLPLRMGLDGFFLNCTVLTKILLSTRKAPNCTLLQPVFFNGNACQHQNREELQ